MNTPKKICCDNISNSVKNNCPYCFKFFLGQNKNIINYKDVYGNSFLHLAKCSEIIYLSIENDVNVNIKNDIGDTPLHSAVYINNNKSIKILLEKGANPNIQNCYGNTPLHYLSIVYHFEQFKKLIEYGADPYIKNNNGENCFDVADFEIGREKLKEIYNEHISLDIKEPSED